MIRALLATIAVALAIAPAAAAKPRTVASVSLDQSAPHYGDAVTFTVSEHGYLNVDCYQDGVLVMNSWASYLGGAGQSFGLYSPVWKSGAADCVAQLNVFLPNGKLSVVGSTSFEVAA